MASHINPTLGFSLLQEPRSNEIIKKSQFYLAKSFSLKVENLVLEPWKPFCSLSESNSKHFVESDSTIKKLSSLMEDGNITFPISRVELSDMVSMSRWKKLSRLVPPSQRLDSEVLLLDTLKLNAVNLDAVTVAPVKSPKKTKLKPSPKTRDSEKDLYKRNHLHACESLISLMIGSEQHRRITMLSLKKSCRDLSELLTQFSVGFAGTGIAVFFSVLCNIAYGRGPFCATKVIDTALGFSLVLLSWTVNRLRKTIVDVNRKAIKEEEMINRVERSIKDVYFKAATVVAMVALRLS